MAIAMQWERPIINDFTVQCDGGGSGCFWHIAGTPSTAKGDIWVGGRAGERAERRKVIQIEGCLCANPSRGIAGPVLGACARFLPFAPQGLISTLHPCSLMED